VVQRDPDRLEEALQFYKDAHKIKPECDAFIIAQAEIYCDLEEYDSAVKLLKSLPIENSNPYLLGKIYHKQGKLQEAIRVLTIARDISGKGCKVRELMDEIIEAIGDDEFEDL
jgi:tetratricopeptide (TPR) repeat protein